MLQFLWKAEDYRFFFFFESWGAMGDLGFNFLCTVQCEQFSIDLYTERQKKLITSSERRLLKSTASKLIILRHI